MYIQGSLNSKSSLARKTDLITCQECDRFVIGRNEDKNSVIVSNIEFFAKSIGLDDQELEILSRKCKNIETWKLMGNIQITDGGIRSLAMNCLQLSYLNLYGLNQITDESIILISNNGSSLRKLYLHGCTRLTYRSINALAKGCPSLDVLSLSYSRTFKVNHFQNLDAKSRKISCLMFHDCRVMTEFELEDFEDGLAKFSKVVKFSNNQIVSYPKKFKEG